MPLEGSALERRRLPWPQVAKALAMWSWPCCKQRGKLADAHSPPPWNWSYGLEKPGGLAAPFQPHTEMAVHTMQAGWAMVVLNNGRGTAPTPHNSPCQAARTTEARMMPMLQGQE